MRFFRRERQDPKNGRKSKIHHERRLGYSEWNVEVVERKEGYKEFRCIPARWTYQRIPPVADLVAEGLSGFLQIDRDPDFWSASDAASRACEIGPHQLGLRELALLATRRSSDYNRPRPWAAQAQVEEIEENWGGRHDPNVHPFAHLPRDSKASLWEHYGMTRLVLSNSSDYDVVTGYSISPSRRAAAAYEPWHGGLGTWYSWSDVLEWSSWPKRQAVTSSAKRPGEGDLLLFISHRWEDLEHPDPTGRQLLAVKTGLTIALAAALRSQEDRRTGSGLPEVFSQYLARLGAPDTDQAIFSWAEAVEHIANEATDEASAWEAFRRLDAVTNCDPLKRIRDNILVWYDYASMYQAPRLGQEENDFQLELARLNEIQSAAATVVIAGDERYLTRAWCFLEICGGIRRRLVELTPSWGESIGASSSGSKWASISDQFIGALRVLGIEAIYGTELQATHVEDLNTVASLIRQLPLVGLVTSDGSDLIGGSIPMPFRGGRWLMDGSRPQAQRTLNVIPIKDFGAIPDEESLSRAIDAANADELTGTCGIWVYTTQRLLSLVWACRADEFYNRMNSVIDLGKKGSVACTWADSRALAENGIGWTRYVPSTVKNLLIITQADLPEVCLLYERVVNTHIAAGVSVITFTPETGSILVSTPPPANDDFRGSWQTAHALVVRRVRRTTAYPKYLLLQPDISHEQVDMMAALRIQPDDLIRAPASMRRDQLRESSELRVRAEGEARTIAASWEAFAEKALPVTIWAQPSEAQARLVNAFQILDQLVEFSDNPLIRRQALYAILKDS